MKNKVVKIITVVIMIMMVVMNVFSCFATDTNPDENSNGTVAENTTPVVPEPKPEPEPEPEPEQNTTVEPEPEPVNNTGEENNNKVTENEVETNTVDENENQVTNTVTNTINTNTTNTIKTNTITNTVTDIDENSIDIGSEDTADQVNMAINYAKKEQKLDLSDKGLTSLTVFGYDAEGKQYVLALSPDFNTNIYTYSILAGLNISRIEIEYELVEKDGTVEKLGKTELEPGVNFITLIARNSDFSENVTYQISINKLDESVLPKEDGLGNFPWTTKYNDVILYGCIVVIIADVILYIVLKYFMAKESKISKDSKVRNRINVNDIVKGLEEENETNIKKNKGKH